MDLAIKIVIFLFLIIVRVPDIVEGETHYYRKHFL